MASYQNDEGTSPYVSEDIIFELFESFKHGTPDELLKELRITRNQVINFVIKRLSKSDNYNFIYIDEDTDYVYEVKDLVNLVTGNKTFDQLELTNYSDIQDKPEVKDLISKLNEDFTYSDRKKVIFASTVDNEDENSVEHNKNFEAIKEYINQGRERSTPVIPLREIKERGVEFELSDILKQLYQMEKTVENLTQIELDIQSYKTKRQMQSNLKIDLILEELKKGEEIIKKLENIEIDVQRYKQKRLLQEDVKLDSFIEELSELDSKLEQMSNLEITTKHIKEKLELASQIKLSKEQENEEELTISDKVRNYVDEHKDEYENFMSGTEKAREQTNSILSELYQNYNIDI